MSNILTKEQQNELVQKILIVTDKFCTDHGIDVDSLDPDEWDSLREQFALCYRQAQYLVGADKIS